MNSSFRLVRSLGRNLDIHSQLVERSMIRLDWKKVGRYLLKGRTFSYEFDHFSQIISSTLSFMNRKNLSQYLRTIHQYSSSIHHNSHIPTDVHWKCLMENDEDVIVEFSSPNIAKPLHVGHLRSTFLGNVISNFLQLIFHNENRIHRFNYLGDWGTQFGYLLNDFNESKLNESSEDFMKYISHHYVHSVQELPKMEASRLFSQIENNSKLHFIQNPLNDDVLNVMGTNPYSIYSKQIFHNCPYENVNNWLLISQKSFEELIRIYQKLNVHFDFIDCESMSSFFQDHHLTNCLLESSITRQSNDGTISFHHNGQDIIVLKKHSADTIYLWRDLLTINRRKKIMRNLSKIYYVVDESQSIHFNRLKYLQENLCSSPVEIKQIGFGRIIGMQTRKGNVVNVEDYFDTISQKTIDGLQRLKFKCKDITSSSYHLTLTHLIMNDMMRSRKSETKFCSEDIIGRSSISFSLQYLHVRLSSLRKRIRKEREFGDFRKIPDSFKNHEEFQKELELIHLIGKFPEVLSDSIDRFEPYLLIQYLIKLNSNRCLATQSVLKETNLEVGECRYWIFECVRIILGISLELIGVKPLEEL
ncbi:hypothetical protein SNEBB_007387 [Seison nebaliae]|nr:hypothetical protein SNEBB_007387 [Seison nebaliae]